jgi:hypothetical protein
VTTLGADLGNAYSTTTGLLDSTMNPAYVQAFVEKFTTEEQQQAALARAGKPYYIPDPVAAVSMAKYLSSLVAR